MMAGRQSESDIGAFRVAVYCANASACHHSAEFIVAELAARFGRPLSLVEDRRALARRLVCTECGTRHPDMIIAEGARPSSVTGSSHGVGASISVAEASRRHVARRAEARKRDAEAGLPERPTGGSRQFGKPRRYSKTF